MECVDRRQKEDNKKQKEISELKQILLQKDAEIANQKSTIEKLKYDSSIMSSKLTDFKQLEI